MEPSIDMPSLPTPPTQPTTIAISSSATPVDQWLRTPKGQSDVLVKVISPIAAISIRVAKTYVQSLIGFLAASGLGLAPSVLPSGDFVHLMAKAAGLAVAPAVMSLLYNLSTLLTDLGDKFPVLKS